jgi:hypothetical protein
VELKSTRAKVGCLFVGLLVVFTAGYWILARHSDDPLDIIVADLQKRSISPAARLIKKSDPERTRLSANASWEIESDQDWKGYSQDLLHRFHDFKIAESPDGKITMSKQLPGDTLYLTFEKIADNPLKIRVSFRGYPS